MPLLDKNWQRSADTEATKNNAHSQDKKIYSLLYRSRDSVVGIATAYGLEFESR
jgi:hypothetical protein